MSNFRQRYHAVCNSVSEALNEELSVKDEERLAELVITAKDASGAAQEDALHALGKFVAGAVTDYVRSLEDSDEPEQLLGNPAYDLVAADRRHGGF
jgi:hypothetical protein